MSGDRDRGCTLGPRDASISYDVLEVDENSARGRRFVFRPTVCGFESRSPIENSGEFDRNRGEIRRRLSVLEKLPVDLAMFPLVIYYVT